MCTFYNLLSAQMIIRLPVCIQHLKDYLDLEQSALKYMMRCYPEEKEEEQMRRSLGRYGLTGKQQVSCLHLMDLMWCRY